MFLLYPHERYHSVCEIDAQHLLNLGINSLILDVDNTLTTHDNPRPADGVLRWLAMVQEQGINCMILSNNSAERVKPFAEMLKLPYESKAKKPLTKGFRRACHRMGSSPTCTAVIGDQLFTDILGGRSFGAFCILVDLIEPEHTAFFKFKRLGERILLKGYRGAKP